MSFITEQVQRIDAHLDRAQLAQLSHPASDSAAASRASTDTLQASSTTARVRLLQTSIRALSISSSSAGSTEINKLLLRPAQIQQLLSTSLLPPTHPSTGAVQSQPAAKADSDYDDEEEDEDSLERSLEWLLVSKATAQAYGHVLSRILDAAGRQEEEAWWWGEVAASRRAGAVLYAQTTPLRLLGWGRGVWAEVRARTGGDVRESVRRGWGDFYALVREVVAQRRNSVRSVRAQVLSPLRRLAEEARARQRALRRLRMRNANALGVLLGEGLANESMRAEDGRGGNGLLAAGAGDVHGEGRRQWRAVVARNVALMEAVLVKINDLDAPLEKFDAGVAALTDDDPLYAVESLDAPLPPRAVADRLVRLLAIGLPHYADTTQALVTEHGRPSRMVRYWLPVTVGVLSASTVLRMLFSRQAQLVANIQDLGATIVDFWTNWVVEPTRNLIKTIRHDEGSEISIMSKRSLEGDRASLERMVVDFAIDNPANATGSSARLTDAEIADIRIKVREGDLTPVLKAYEKELASPLMGSLRGSLIRALLIQIQKTKVDVEVAMGGIDALLKSQELCIGIIGLTPGLLVTYFLFRWLQSSFSDKRGSESVHTHDKMLRQLRNIDRILTSSTSTEFGELAYKDQGLLLCEVHALRQAAVKCMPDAVYKEFGEDVDELCDVRVGVQRQRSVVDRVRWVYWKWLS